MGLAAYRKQNGFSLSGLLSWAILVVAVALFGLKLAPPYITNYQIKQAFNSMVRDSELRNVSDYDLRIAFGKRASVSNITEIRPEQVVVVRKSDGFELSAHYTVKVPLAGNASLLLEFNPVSSK